MFLRHPLLASWRVDHGFGTIQSPARNDCRTVRQVHGTRIIALPGQVDGRETSEADGLLSESDGVEVGVWTADCLPVLMATEGGQYVGAFHAGWRGAVSGIAVQGLLKLIDLSGEDHSRIRVVLGPAIGPCCFEVGPEVWDAVDSGTPRYEQKDKRTLDLWNLVTFQLRMSGLSPASVGSVSLCTRCHPDLFFSHRGWGPERKGRSMLNYIRPSGK